MKRRSEMIAVPCARLAIMVGALLACMEIARAADPFMTPAIDANMFKENAIHSFSNTIDEWSYACQELKPIRKRICNLATHLKDAANQYSGSALIATDERNATAMLLRLPPPAVVASPVVIRTQFPVAKDARKRVNYEKQANIGFCTGTACSVFVALDDEIIFAINNAIDVTVQYMRPTDDIGAGWAPRMRMQPVSLKIAGDGFAAALREATRE
jgi:invasion protein IalB